MKKIACLAASCLLSSAANAAVVPVTIDFEDVAPIGGGAPVTPTTPYVEDGFTLTPSNDEAAIIDSAFSVFTPPTSSDWFAFSDTNIVTLTSNLTSTFNLYSFLAGPESFIGGITDLFITGNVYDGTTLTSSLTNLTTATPTVLGWSNLLSVDFSSSTVGGLDNIVADIPEPAPLALLSLGLVGLGLSRAKKYNS